jgi:hypothetical protein
MLKKCDDPIVRCDAAIALLERRSSVFANRFRFSLAPGFSRVKGDEPRQKRFQPFPPRIARSR